MATREAVYQSIGDPIKGDELQGTWPHRRIVAMDAKFSAQLERAIAAGDERRPDGDSDARRDR